VFRGACETCKGRPCRNRAATAEDRGQISDSAGAAARRKAWARDTTAFELDARGALTRFDGAGEAGNFIAQKNHQKTRGKAMRKPVSDP